MEDADMMKAWLRMSRDSFLERAEDADMMKAWLRMSRDSFLERAEETMDSTEATSLTEAEWNEGERIKPLRFLRLTAE